jgi:hypothetical protein
VTIHVHIDRLVLDGFSLAQSDGALVHAAVQHELVRLLAQRGFTPALATGGAFASIAGGTVRAGSTTRPAALGEGIAAAVHSGIGDRR